MELAFLTCFFSKKREDVLYMCLIKNIIQCSVRPTTENTLAYDKYE